jgi:UDP-N-acetylglucosamine transferase subunit ALG13
MNVENINTYSGKPRVLLVPLDWGLGHATRCIPIIHALQNGGAEVLLAGEGAIVKILEKAHPNTVILPLKGYRVVYSRHKRLFMLKMLLQSFKIYSAIQHENKWLKKVIQRYRIDAVISDNRFGLYNETIPSVFITHQLYIATGYTFLDHLAQKINYTFINKFSTCWIPDVAGENNFAGKLSHPKKLPLIPTRYIGAISRFSKSPVENKNGLLVILSGPEPQRSIFERKLLLQIKAHHGKITLVRGLPLSSQPLFIENKNVVVHDHLPAEELEKLIGRSLHIIARCGYSTIMDLLAMNCTAILVPTPGQTEQEYLARHLLQKKLFYTCSQEEFVLEKAIEKAGSFNFVSPKPLASIHQDIISDWLKEIMKR